ncbi:MAG: T9SS type A sorting domain-containing protein [Patescibacteria group bacterium]|nr:T9SS type A sorting domain-containing protein [Patescibacteria group bacterium]
MFNSKSFLKRSVMIVFLAIIFATSLLVAQFNPLNGPYGHYVYSIAFDTSGNPIVGAYEYIWRYDGSTWNKVALLPNDMPTYPTVAPFRPLISNGSTMYQFDHTFVQDGYMWKSTDNGLTWNYVLPSGLPNSPPLCLTFDKNQNLLLGSGRPTGETVGGGIWKSTDNGSNWSLLGNQNSAGLDTIAVLSVAVNTDTFYAGTKKGVFKSTDNGSNWLKLTELTNISIVSIAIKPNGYIFAGSDAAGYGCYRSTDNGLTWFNQLNLGENHRAFITITNSGTIFVAGLDNDGIYRSTDNGDNWQSVNTGLLTDLPNGKDVRLIAVNQSGTLFAGTTTDGLFKSTNDGDNWTQIGIPISVKTTCLNEPYVFASGLSQLHRSTNNGNSWGRLDVGINDAIDALAIDSIGNIFVGTPNNKIRKSTDSGSTWNATGFSVNAGIRSLAINSNNHIFAGTSFYGIYKSTDNGNSWNQSDGGVTNIVVSLAISKSSKNFDYIFAGTLGLDPGGVYRSTDSGTTWTKPSSTLDVYTINTLAVNDKGYVFAGTSDGVFRSKNDGETWTGPLLEQIAQSEKSNFSTLASGPSSVTSITTDDSNFVYAGTQFSGVWKSMDDGDTWERMDQTLMAKQIYGFNAQTQIDPNVSSVALDDSGYLYVGTASGLMKSAEPVNVLPLPPAPPILILPENDATELPRNMTLKWNSNPDASSYQIQVSTDSNFATTKIDSNGLTDTLMNAQLEYNTKYFWRVRGVNIGGTGNWSEIWDFTTAQYSYLYSIKDGWNMISISAIIGDNRKITLFPTAISNAFGYANGYFSSDTLNIGYGYWLKFSTAQEINISGPEILAETINVNIGWNMIGSISKAVPTAMITSDPPNLIVSNFFRYNPDSGRYEITDTVLPGVSYWVKTNQNGKLILEAGSQNLSKANIIIKPDSDLPPPPPIKSGNETKVLPEDFALYQNYPNPWNPQTKISFDLPKDELVSFKVYNVLGEEIMSFERKPYEAGRYEILLDGSKFASGVYFYQIQAGSFFKILKMILVK